MKPTRIVMVHGAGHGGWAWEEVVPRLEARGWSTTAVDMPMVTLAEDAAIVRNAIEEAKKRGEGVVLVLHSYAGQPGSAGGHAADHIVYCAATVPDGGAGNETLGDVTKVEVEEDAAPPPPPPGLIFSEDGKSATMEPGYARGALFNRCTTEQADRALPRLGATHIECFLTPIEDPAWQHVPSSYIITGQDNSVDQGFQRSCAAKIGDFVEFEGADHSLYYSATEQLVDYLDGIAKRVSNQS